MQARLIVTSYDHSVQLWNLNDGTPLFQAHPQLYTPSSTSTCKNITTIQYEIININNKTKEKKKYILIGTDTTTICGYQEINSIIEEIPSIYLNLTDYKAAEHRVNINNNNNNSNKNKMNLNKLVTGLVENKKNRQNSISSTTSSGSGNNNDNIIHEKERIHENNYHTTTTTNNVNAYNIEGNNVLEGMRAGDITITESRKIIPTGAYLCGSYYIAISLFLFNLLFMIVNYLT